MRKNLHISENSVTHTQLVDKGLNNDLYGGVVFPTGKTCLALFNI